MLERLFKLGLSKGMKLGLERMRMLDELLGCPSKSFRSIHVGGTNGKGSTTYKIAKALQCPGRKVGLYTSPHISTVRERIQVNGDLISWNEMHMHLEKIFAKASSKNLEPTFFEVITLLGFLHFQKMQVDVAVIEVGLGGRLDATNIITPLLSIITSIGYDHTQYLGNNLEEIAVEKGGIIKPRVPILLGEQASKQKILHRMAAMRESPCYFVPESFLSYEEENSACAQKALDILPFKTFSQDGILKTPPCRFEHVKSGNCDVILDVGHNPCAIKSLLRRLEERFPKQKCAFVVGFSADKDVEAMLDLLMPIASVIYLTKPIHNRAFEPSLGAQYLQKKKFSNYIVEKNIQDALRMSIENHALVTVCGTFYIMADARIVLGFSESKDEFTCHL